MLNVTKAYLPLKEKFLSRIDRMWETHILTNNGPYVNELEERLKEYSGCPHVLACTNATIALQLALRAMNITKQVITTPFSYVATTNAILWERCEPVFVDINEKNYTIDINKIENYITEDTQAILVTHVYGSPCDVDAIQTIANKHNLKIVYDAANSFGSFYKGKSIFTFGDISVCSFHATKIFHSVEGGALFINNEKYAEQLSLFRAFGHIHDDYYSIGINAKMSELHAAMALCVFEDINEIIEKRKEICLLYSLYIKESMKFSFSQAHITYNYAYYPILFKDEDTLNQAIQALREKNIFPRRYFYPSLNKLPFLKTTYSCPVSENIACRIICMPLSHYTTESEVKQVSEIINKFK